MGNIPLPALAVQPPPSPVEQVSRLLALRSMLNQQQMQGQQIQQAQNETQSSGIDLQMKQIGLKNAQAEQSALADPNFQQDFKDWQNSKGGTPTATAGGSSSGALQLHPVAQYLVERKGLPLFGPNGGMDLSNMLTSAAQKTADLAKTQGEAGEAALKNHSTQLDNFNDLVEPILTESDPAKQQQQIDGLQQEIQGHPELYPVEAVQNVGKWNNIQNLQAASNVAKIRQMILDDATRQAQASKETVGAAVPTSQQIQDASRTVSTYGAIPQNMRNGLLNEMRNAPNFDALQKVQARADAANESFQRSADARTQAAAMKDVALQNLVAGKLVTEDQQLGKSLDETGAIRRSLNMASGGNEQAAAAAKQLFAEHIVREGGINRFNELEQQGLIGNMGTFGRQIESWASKGFDPKQIPNATNKEIQTIIDAEDQASTAAHDRNVGFITNRYIGKNQGTGLPQSGNGGVSPPGAPAKVPPPGATHVVPGRDGRNHYTNAQGTVDYGIAP